MRVILCGGRDHPPFTEHAIAYLDMLHEQFHITGILHGGQTGADREGGAWGSAHGIKVTPVEADWQVYGNAAGPIRNKAMGENLRRHGPPYGVIVFPGGKGTASMVAIAKSLAIPLYTYTPGLNSMPQRPSFAIGAPRMPRMTSTVTASAEGNPLGPAPTDDIPEDFATPLTVLTGPVGSEVTGPVETATMLDPEKANLIEMVNEVFVTETPATTMNEALYAITKHALHVIKALDGGFEKATSTINREALMAMARAVEHHSPTTPYRAEIQAIAPSGYAMTLTVEERTQEAFLTATGGLLRWLKEKGFKTTGGEVL